MRFMSLLITMAVCLTACGHHQPSLSSLSDAEVQKKLTGTWREQGEHAVCTFVVASNGDFVTQGVFNEAHGVRKLTMKGTWIVKNGILIQTYTKSSQTNAHLPISDPLAIVRLDDRELVLRYDGRRPEIIEMVYQRVIK
jgi:hypothetical protein